MRRRQHTCIVNKLVCLCAVMCGRCASSRDIQGVRRACAYRPRSGGGGGKSVKPSWYQCTPQTYYPSYNICPQTNTPVLISGQHQHVLEHQKTTLTNDEESLSSTLEPEERVLQVMQWGLVPSWHRGDSPSSFGTILNNCRQETMLEKPSFRSAVEKRRRCVVVADGFFEWQRDKGQKQPYFIYFTDRGPSEEMVEVCSGEGEEVKGEREEVKGEGRGSEWECPIGRMLTMAGLFDIWRPSNAGEALLYSYTVITVEASSTFAKIHHRMPAILDGQEAVGAWLNPAHSTRDVFDLLRPVECLSWHTVSSVVNNSRNHSPECVLPYDSSEGKSSGGQKTTLMRWFTPQQETEQETASPVLKKPKLQ